MIRLDLILARIFWWLAWLFLDASKFTMKISRWLTNGEWK